MVPRDTTIQDAPDEPLPLKYSITSYGTDFDVEGLVRRIDRGDIYVPTFQRRFVWNLKRASRFVESLLLGLPVPGIFLSKDGESRHLVIDGQQRLKSLQYFCQGVFRPTNREFALSGLVSRFNGKTYQSLDPEDKRRLNDSIIHATVIRQDQPDDGNSSIYFVFERLNTGGVQLQPQEIRTALYHGPFNDLLHQLNDNQNWRSLFGPVHTRQRDQELILRFLALYFWSGRYEKPLKDFLNRFMGANRYLEPHYAAEMASLFEQTTAAIMQGVGDRAFRPRRSLNAAIADSIMVGVAQAWAQGCLETDRMRNQYERLLENTEYQRVTETATTDEDTVQHRLGLARAAFSA